MLTCIVAMQAIHIALAGIIFSDQSSRDQGEDAFRFFELYYVVLGIFLIPPVIVLIAVGALLSFHIYIVVTGTTTYLFLKGKTIKHSEPEEGALSPPTNKEELERRQQQEREAWLAKREAERKRVKSSRQRPETVALDVVSKHHGDKSIGSSIEKKSRRPSTQSTSVITPGPQLTAELGTPRIHAEEVKQTPRTSIQQARQLSTPHHVKSRTSLENFVVTVASVISGTSDVSVNVSDGVAAPPSSERGGKDKMDNFMMSPALHQNNSAAPAVAQQFSEAKMIGMPPTAATSTPEKKPSVDPVTNNNEE
eukprot:CAMPEP_0197527704 /NCGR_PEP_ID=MMETSP1318-20131121/22615_1 /TAXON_ID=552666 /ORGANISM="Partenskyella glossopodia, Strain RCC365" /LENGTH=307 /DNA_ID=CAMNT_0043082487 /DNA_START=499 /DNA_END=1422 /DNA_ORIENTATION=-